MEYEIIEIDRDYRRVTQTSYKDFATQQEADAWCRENTWTGYEYYAKPVVQRETHPGDALTYNWRD